MKATARQTGAITRAITIAMALVILLAAGGCGASRAAIPATPTPAASPTTTPEPGASLPPLPSPSATPAPLPTFTPVPTPVPGGLYVDVTQRLGTISPFVYGTNIGPWTGIPLDMQDELKQARLTFLRFPGGSYGDENDLRAYQIDQFIAECRQLGAEPAISVRLIGGSPEYAAAVVRYANIDKKYNVRYWSIGNEPSLYDTRPNVDYDTQRYNTEWRSFATAMRKVDPSILLVGPDIHQFDEHGGPRDALGRYWMREFLLANGDLVDIVSFHRYPFPKQRTDPAPGIEELRANTVEWDRMIPALRSLIRETIGRDLPIAVTEINSNWTAVTGGEATPDSFYNAIWWSDVLGRLIRQRVEIVAQFAIHGPAGQGWGLVESYEPRPSYYVYLLYRHFGDELIYASSDDPGVAIYAARRGDGMLTLMIVNLASHAIEKQLTIDGLRPAPSAETWRLDRDHPAVQIDDTPMKKTSLLHLPAESVTLLVVQPE